MSAAVLAPPSRPSGRKSGRLLSGLGRALVVATAILAAGSVALVLGITLWAKALNGNAQVVVVTSNSMEPQFSANDVLAVAEVDPKTLQPDQIITMKRPTGVLVTHRILTVENEDGQVVLTTKGDNNASADPDKARGDQVVGVVRGSLPGLAEALLWVQTPLGRVLTLAPFFLVMAGRLCVRLWRPDEDEATVPSEASNQASSADLHSDSRAGEDATSV